MDNILVTLAWLRAIKQLNWFSLLITVAGYFQGASWSILLALPIQYYFLRITFDSYILQTWLDHPERITQFDAQLTQIGLSKQTPAPRELNQRLVGCVRLSKIYLGWIILQSICLSLFTFSHLGKVW